MKKLILSIVLALLLSTIFLPAAFGYTISPTIYIGQFTKAGYMKITPNADGSITLEFMMKGGEGWCLTEAQVHVGTSLDDFPVNPTRPGHFDYKLYGPDALCTTKLTRTIYPNEMDPQWAHGDHIYMAIHTVVDNPFLGIYDETGWTVRCGVKEEHYFEYDKWASGLWLEILPYEWD